MRGLFGAALAVMLLAGSAAVAKPIPDGGPTAKEFVEVLQAAGYKAELGKDDLGDPMITSGAGGKTFLVFFYDCKSNRCTNYQFSAGYDLDKGMTADKVVEWAQKFRFARIHLDDEKDPYLRFDVDAEKGHTTEAIGNNVDRWVGLMGEFQKFIDW